jgi:hypothetical protein
MNDHNRLDQLHVLIGRLERMPASPDRDWIMREIRARAVDVEIGERPRPVRPRNPDAETSPGEAAGPERSKPRARTPRQVTVTQARAVDRPTEIQPPKPPSPPAAAPAGRDGRVDLLELGGVLCLGEPPAEAPQGTGRVASPPWARGLRG